MILFQATFVALTGYGLGVGLCALVILLARLYLPDYAAMISYWNLGLAFGITAAVASTVHRVARTRWALPRSAAARR